MAIVQMKFLNYKDFLNEWIFTDHYLKRANRFHKESRTSRYSKDRIHGWKCMLLSRLDKDGNETKQAMRVDEFLSLTKMSEDEFEDKISRTLEMLVTSKKSRDIDFDPDEKIHRFMYLGKIAFKVGNELLAPVLMNLVNPEKVKGDYVAKLAGGSRVWGDIKNNKIITFIFLPDSYEDKHILGRGSTNPNRMKEFQDKPNEPRFPGSEYRKMIRIEYLRDKKSIIKILDTPDWANLVKQQIEYDKEV